MKITTVIGLIAATITTLSFIPQLIKTWKLKETKDISLLMFVTLGVGIILWIIYGFLFIIITRQEILNGEYFSHLYVYLCLWLLLVLELKLTPRFIKLSLEYV